VRVAEQAAQGGAELGREAVGQRARASDGAALSRGDAVGELLAVAGGGDPGAQTRDERGDDARGLKELAHGGGEDGVDEDLGERGCALRVVLEAGEDLGDRGGGHGGDP
jgi:hypothetical protein